MGERCSDMSPPRRERPRPTGITVPPVPRAEINWGSSCPGEAGCRSASKAAQFVRVHSRCLGFGRETVESWKCVGGEADGTIFGHHLKCDYIIPAHVDGNIAALCSQQSRAYMIYVVMGMVIIRVHCLRQRCVVPVETRAFKQVRFPLHHADCVRPAAVQPSHRQSGSRNLLPSSSRPR